MNFWNGCTPEHVPIRTVAYHSRKSSAARCVVLFYLASFHLYQAWSPLLVLIFLQLCLVCENVHNVHYVWNLAARTQTSETELPSLHTQLPTMLGSHGLADGGFLAFERFRDFGSLSWTMSCWVLLLPSSGFRDAKPRTSLAIP